MPRTIVLDCDPGHDDAIAMLLAHAHPGIDLAAVTTVAGNQTLPKVTRNALAVATICGMTGVPIAAGAAHPLVRPVRIAPDIHGESGMDGPALPDPAVPLDGRHGVDLIIDTVLSRPAGAVTLVPTGPLTNIALAARKAPQIVDRVAEVVLMGGGYAGGNTTAAADEVRHRHAQRVRAG
jgi:purine nucleosidase